MIPQPPATPKQRRTAREKRRTYNPADVRAWADAQGWTRATGDKFVGTTGRLPQPLIDAYTQAHQEQP